MVVYNYSFQEIKEIINDNFFMGKGLYGKGFLHKGHILRFYKNAYKVFKYSKELDEISKNQLLNGNLINVSEIEYLASKQESISLSKLPMGIVTVSLIPVAVIDYYHQAYHNLNSLEDISYQEFYNLMSSILCSLKELEDNEIDFLNLETHNILYDGVKTELINFEGHVNLDIKSRGVLPRMYADYSELFFDLLRRCADLSIIHKFSDNDFQVKTYQEGEVLVKKLKKML